MVNDMPGTPVRSIMRDYTVLWRRVEESNPTAKCIDSP